VRSEAAGGGDLAERMMHETHRQQGRQWARETACLSDGCGLSSTAQGVLSGRQGPLLGLRDCFLDRSSLVPAAGERLVARTAVPQADPGFSTGQGSRREI